MQNAPDHTLVQSDHRNDSHNAIISSLGSLVEQVRANMKLIESAIASEAVIGDQEASIIVLDDVTPHYLRANAALNACNAGLGIALHLLRDVRPSKRETGAAEGQPVCSARCA